MLAGLIKLMFKKAHFGKALLYLTLAIMIIMSWYYMAFLMTMNMDPVANWHKQDIIMLFFMWAIMMAGMMLPSVTPLIMLVNQLNEKRKIRQAPYAHTMFFILGYLLVWFLFSLVITLIQWLLHYYSVLTPMMISAHLSFTSLLLLCAGIYQWLPIKQRCLSLCRSPLSFLMKEWREGQLNAIKLGSKHGAYCLGCCWVLMALLFVTGVMSLKWIFILTLVVLIEKLAPFGEIISKLLGVGLIISSMVLYLR